MPNAKTMGVMVGSVEYGAILPWVYLPLQSVKATALRLLKQPERCGARGRPARLSEQHRDQVDTDFAYQPGPDGLLHDIRAVHDNMPVSGDRLGLPYGTSTPSVTKVNGDPGWVQPWGTVCVTTNTGTSSGCRPPRPFVTSGASSSSYSP